MSYDEWECARACDADAEGPGSSSLSGVRSLSLMNGDFARFTSFFAPRESERVRELLLPFDMDEDWGSSSVLGVEIGLVELRENRDMLRQVGMVPEIHGELPERSTFVVTLLERSHGSA